MSGKLIFTAIFTCLMFQAANASDWDDCFSPGSHDWESMNQERKQDGLRACDKIVPKYSGAELAKIYATRGYWKVRLDRTDDAIEDYNLAIKTDPKNLEFFIFKGYAYSIKKDYDRAIENYNTTLDANPNRAFALVRRGESYHAKGDVERARKDYTLAANTKSTDRNEMWARDYAKGLLKQLPPQ